MMEGNDYGPVEASYYARCVVCGVESRQGITGYSSVAHMILELRKKGWRFTTQPNASYCPDHAELANGPEKIYPGMVKDVIDKNTSQDFDALLDRQGGRLTDENLRLLAIEITEKHLHLLGNYNEGWAHRLDVFRRFVMGSISREELEVERSKRDSPVMFLDLTRDNPPRELVRWLALSCANMAAWHACKAQFHPSAWHDAFGASWAESIRLLEEKAA